MLVGSVCVLCFMLWFRLGVAAKEYTAVARKQRADRSSLRHFACHFRALENGISKIRKKCQITEIQFVPIFFVMHTHINRRKSKPRGAPKSHHAIPRPFSLLTKPIFSAQDGYRNMIRTSVP